MQQAGGFPRRATAIARLRAQHGDKLLVIDGGGNADNCDEIGTATAETLTHCMAELGYDAIGLGEDEVSFGREFLDATLMGAEFELPLISANVVTSADGVRIVPSHIIKDLGGVRVAVVSVARDHLPEGFLRERREGLEARPPAPVVDALVAELAPRVDLIILMAHLGLEAAQELGRRYDRQVLVLASGITAHSARPTAPAPVASGSKVIVTSVGALGQWLGIYRVDVHPPTGTVSVRSESKELVQGTFPADREMQEIIDEYNRGLERFVVTDVARRNELMAELIGDGHAYMGAGRCFPCHDVILKSHLGTPHGSAFRVLERLPARRNNPHCLSCHTTFFNMVEVPGEGKKGIFADVGVGCEECHGPAGEHVDDPDDPQKMSGFHEVTAETCTRCHTEEQSPDFDFARFWGKVGHPKPAPPRKPHR